ncbi:hypothetical protein B4135_2235 [Caldibacillus debilis]|uniref:Uncharacterized protein n=1 Tax=Caldibacillus debilis TaxID=301148 RepID=A0A150M210_9BACI|nr:hypothetical protein B4135_2235 [Caldibacillus debilis]
MKSPGGTKSTATIGHPPTEGPDFSQKYFTLSQMKDPDAPVRIPSF